MNRRIDYDQIAHSYDQRYQSNTMAGESAALLKIVHKLGEPRVLEVGCGTGHWLGELAPIASSLYGLDRSIGMLAQADAKRIPAFFTQGQASKIPFQDSVFDFLFCLNAIHHFTHPALFIQEAYRVISSGGFIAVIGGDIPARHQSWYIYSYFEGTYETDLKRFPPWARLSAWIEEAGFQDVELVEVDHIIDNKRGSEVLSDPFLAKESCSQLALLSRLKYDEGLENIRKDLELAEIRGEQIIFEVDFKILMLTGRK